MNTQFDKSKWALWGNWNNSVLFASIWAELRRSTIVQEMHLQQKGDLKILNGYFWVPKEDMKKLKQYAIESLESDQEYFNKIFSVCYRKKEDLLQIENKTDIKYFIQQIVDYVPCVTIIVLTGIQLDSYYKKKCAEINFSFNDFILTIKPTKPTYLMQYQAELKTKNIDYLHKKYAWIATHGIDGDPLTKNAIAEEIKADNPPQKKAPDVPKELARIHKIACEMAYLRTVLMETLSKVCFSYRPQLEKLAKQYNLTYQDLQLFTWPELLELIDNRTIPKNLKKRNPFGLLQLDGKYTILTEKELEKEEQIHASKINSDDQVKGMCAFPGIVEGTVKVCESHKEENFNKGDILVVSETTTDFLPLIYKAAAIITNNGGITSHACIIARELSKPCIIGTKVATKVLKTGDKVHINAKEGTVKKI